MPYRLRFDGVNDIVQITGASSFNAGTSAYVIRWKGVINAFPVSGLTGIVGTISGSNSNGVVMHASEGSGGCRMYGAGTSAYGSGAGFIQVGVDNEYALEHDSGTGAYRWKRNGVIFSSGTFTSSSSVQKLDQFGRSSGTSTSYLSADIETFYVDAGGFTTTWDSSLSGGTGSILYSVGGTNNGTLVNFPTNDSQWILYGAGVSWSGTIGKTSLSVGSKLLFAALGYSNTNNKSSQTLASKQFTTSFGYSTEVVNNAYNTAGKQQELSAGYNSVSNKQSLTLIQKQLSLSAGASVPFNGILNNSSYVLTAKQLGVTAGWSSGLAISNLPLSTKTEGVEIGGILDIQEQSLLVNEKQLYLQTGTSVSFLGDINVPTLNVTYKALSVSAGTETGFSGVVSKTSLQLSGKVLERVFGQVLSTQKDALELISKQLSIGEQLYPVVPLERIFTLTDKNRTYLFKQTTNIFILSNKENILWL